MGAGAEPDGAWDEGVTLEDRVEGDLDRVHLTQLSWVAHRRMMRAVLRGDAVEALRWRRVRVAMDDENAEFDRRVGQHESIRQDRVDQAGRAAWEASKTDSADSSDGVFTDAACPPTDSIPPGFTQ